MYIPRIIAGFIIVFCCLLMTRQCRTRGDTEPAVAEVKLEQPEFLMSDNPAKDLPKVLKYYGVLHPDIVRAQAILETGHFRSKVFLEYNNLFGLYNSRKKDYYKFEHWTESVLAYINFIQYRYKPPNDYYQFLQDIGYAEDPDYINKIKKVQSRFKYESNNNN